MRLTATMLFATVTVVTAADKAEIGRLASNDPSQYRAAVEAYERAANDLNGLEAYIPELIVGGEWTAVLKLTNFGNMTLTTSSAFFVNNDGSPMSATFQTNSGQTVTGIGFSYTIPPGQTIEATFLGGSSTQFGHAFIPPLACTASVTCRLYAEVILRNRNPTRPDFESVFPLETPAPVQSLMFDHRGGNSTVLYLVNANTSTTAVAVDLLNPQGQLVKRLEFSMGASTSRIETVHALAPETLGQHGVMVVRAANSVAPLPQVVATALRINPSNSFTPLRAYVP